MATPRYTAEHVITALQHSKGMLWLAAKHLGCAPETVLHYGRRAPRGPAVPGEERMVMTELAVWQALPPQGEAWGLAFCLTPLGHARTAGEREVLYSQWECLRDTPVARLAAGDAPPRVLGT